MSDHTDTWQCENCGAVVDVSSLGFYAPVECQICGNTAFVHRRLGNFEVTDILGYGGMSTVYAARDVLLHRDVAVKLLSVDDPDQTNIFERFENECAMMAKVRHPNVVSVYSAGRAGASFYIAMEMVRGMNLEDMVSPEQPLPELQAVEIIEQVANGLAAAYRSGILHRDMKPGNVIISQKGKAKVLDFGLANKKLSTETDEVLWVTPYYAAPETLRREVEDVRTDIYALGMTLRHLVSGQSDFGLAEPPSTPKALLSAKKKLPPLRTVNSALHPALVACVDHMTAFDPARRPENYNVLLRELAEVKMELRIGSMADSPEYRRKRNLMLAGLTGITLLVGAGAAAVNWYLSRPEPEQLVLPLAKNVPIHEIELTHELTACLKSGEPSSIRAQKALELSNQSKECTTAAWAAFCAYFCALDAADPVLRESAWDRFYSVCTEDLNELGLYQSPAGEHFVEQLAYIAENGDEGAETPAPSEKIPELSSSLLSGLAMVRFAHSGTANGTPVNYCNMHITRGKRALEAEKGTYGRIFSEMEYIFKLPE